MSKDCRRAIEEWFQREWGGCLHLPDGFYGRPYDNQHALTSVEVQGDDVTLVLDRTLTLRFKSLGDVQDQGKRLVFDPFTSCEFDTGRSGAPVKNYDQGAVEIIAGTG